MRSVRGRVLGVLGVIALVTGLVSAGNASGDAAGPSAARVTAHASPQAAARPGKDAVGAAGSYVAVTPSRVLDTRIGTGAPKARVGADGTLAVTVAGHGGVPSSGVSAVVMNVTVVSPTAGGHLIVWPAGQPQPVTSNSNFVAGSIVPAMAVSALGTNGAVDLYNGSAGTTDLVMDVQGYYLAGTPTAQGAFVPLTPSRLLDTRIGNGAAAQPVQNNLPLSLTVAGRGGVPLHGAGTVVLNLTVVAPTTGGHAGVDGSNVNFAAHQTVSNLVLAPVQTDGQVRLYADLTGTTALLADVSGYFLAGAPAQAGLFGVVDAARFLDTRSDQGGSTVAARSAITVKVTGANGVPASGVSAVAVNVIATNSTASGFVTAYAGGTTRPIASNLNFAKGQTIDNLVWVPVSSTGTIALYNGSSGTLDLVGDLAGYAGPVPGPLTWAAPTNISATQGGLTSLSCPTATFCAAVDQAGNVVEYNGTTWSKPALVNPLLQFSSVSCPTADFCAATDRHGYVDTFHGTTFGFPVNLDAVYLGGDDITLLYQVSCASASLCVAVDGFDAYVYDGSTWTRHVIYRAPDVTETTGSVSCPTTTFCAVLDQQGYAQFYQSGRWSDLAYIEAGDVISCSSSSFCAAIGSGEATTWDGHSWSDVVQVGSTSASAVSLSCPSATFCLGSNNVGDGLRYNGSTWSARSAPASSLAVSCLTATSCLATSPGPAGRIFGYNGSAWGSATYVDPTQSALTSVSCPTTTFCVTVNATSVLTFNGHTWTRTPRVDDTDHSMVSVSCPTATFCVAVDDGGNEVTYNGHSWSAPLPLTSRALRAVSCSSSTWCMAASATGTTFAFNGSTWAAVPIGEDDPSLYTVDVSCTSSTLCILIDDNGQAFRYDGSSWTGPTQLDNYIGSQFFLATHVSCASSTFCLTDNGYVYDGSSWVQKYDSETPRISCASSSFCVGAQSPSGSFGELASTVATFNGSQWSADSVVDSSSRSVAPEVVDSYWEAVSCASTSFCVVTDMSGNVVVGAGSV